MAGAVAIGKIDGAVGAVGAVAVVGSEGTAAIFVGAEGVTLRLSPERGGGLDAAAAVTGGGSAAG